MWVCMESRLHSALLGMGPSGIQTRIHRGMRSRHTDGFAVSAWMPPLSDISRYVSISSNPPSLDAEYKESLAESCLFLIPLWVHIQVLFSVGQGVVVFILQVLSFVGGGEDLCMISLRQSSTLFCIIRHWVRSLLTCLRSCLRYPGPRLRYPISQASL